MCPEVLPTALGHNIGVHGPHMVRLISALPGKPLGATAYHSDELRRDVGRSLGRLNAALVDVDHIALRMIAAALSRARLTRVALHVAQCFASADGVSAASPKWVG